MDISENDNLSVDNIVHLAGVLWNLKTFKECFPTHLFSAESVVNIRKKYVFKISTTEYPDTLLAELPNNAHYEKDYRFSKRQLAELAFIGWKVPADDTESIRINLEVEDEDEVNSSAAMLIYTFIRYLKFNPSNSLTIDILEWVPERGAISNLWLMAKRTAFKVIKKFDIKTGIIWYN